jgi:hypothetical protein
VTTGQPALERRPHLLLRLVRGPLLFQAGTLGLMIHLVVARRLPVCPPVTMLLGFVAIAVNLDLLPLGAALIGLGLAPLASRADTGSSLEIVAP